MHEKNLRASEAEPRGKRGERKGSLSDKEQSAKGIEHRTHIAHVVVSSSLYEGYYAVALVLEVAYQFDRFGRSALKIAPVVFVSMTIAAVVGLEVDRRLTLRGRDSGLVVSVVWFLISAAALFGVVTRFLPAFPITESTL